MKTVTVFFVFLFCFINSGFGQNSDERILTGKLVLDEIPLVGASIYLKEDPENISNTDINGEFELVVPKNTAFEISIGAFISIEKLNKIKIKKNEKVILIKINGTKVQKIVTEKVNSRN